VGRHVERWIADRRQRGVASAGGDEGRLKLHAIDALGALRLDEVRPRRIRALVRDLAAKPGSDAEQLAPRTVRHVHGLLHTMFEDAVADELIEVNPCALKRGELPKKVDKDPHWRAGAIFSREEVEGLISDEPL
jgi:hypothetical protein